MKSYRRRSSSHQKRKRTAKKWIKKGGCGCEGNKPTLLVGGKIRTRGGGTLGPATYTDYDSAYKYHYPINDQEATGTDPVDPANIVSTRILPNFSGGKRRRTKRARRRIKGGADSSIQNYQANSLSNYATGTVSGALVGADIVSGKPVPAIAFSDNVQYNNVFI